MSLTSIKYCTNCNQFHDSSSPCSTKRKKAKSSTAPLYTSQTVTYVAGTASPTTVTIPHSTGSNNIAIGYSTIGYMQTIHTHKYNILGETYELEMYSTNDIQIIITNINFHGISYYREMKKNKFDLHKDLEEILDRLLLEYERDEKIENIIK